MRQRKYSFFKFSKATALTSMLYLNDYSNGYQESLSYVMDDLNTTMNKMKTARSYDEWLDTVKIFLLNMNKLSHTRFGCGCQGNHIKAQQK